MPPRDELELIDADPTHVYAGLRNVVVAIYFASPPASALRARIPWIERTLERHGAIGQLVVVDPRAAGSLPDRAFRDESRAQTDRYHESILFSATVIEGEGIQHVLVRTFLRGLAVVAGKDLPVRFFDEVPPAARWAEQLARDHDGPSAGALAGAVERLRARTRA